MLFPRFRTRLLRLISRLSSSMSRQSTNLVTLFSPAGSTSHHHHVAVWAGHVTSPDILTDARAYHVISGKRLKEAWGVQHEALLLKVMSLSPNSIPFWLLIERGGATPRAPSRSSTPNSSTTTINRSADTSGQLSSQA